MKGIDFKRIERYDTSVVKVVPFSRTGMTFKGWDISFGNMNPEFPVTFFGYKYPCPEYVYISGFYGKNDAKCIEIQNDIKNHVGGAKTLKSKYRKKQEYTQYGRKDFDNDEWRFHLMLYAVWLKCKQNKRFADMLLAIPEDYVILENQNGFHGWELADWGCKNREAYKAYMQANKLITASNATGIGKLRDEAKLKACEFGIWEGMNHQGKILMACRDALRKGSVPPIDYELLNNAKIFLFGKLLTFSDID